PRQPVALAIDQPARPLRLHHSQGGAQAEGALHLAAEEAGVELLALGPGVEADANAALAVEQPVSDELAGVGDEHDLGAVAGVALDAGDSPGVHPGMPAEERPGPSVLEDYASGHRSLSEPEASATDRISCRPVQRPRCRPGRAPVAPCTA